MLNPGDTAPDFSVTDHLGNTVSLADFRGRHLVPFAIKIRRMGHMLSRIIGARCLSTG